MIRRALSLLFAVIAYPVLWAGPAGAVEFRTPVRAELMADMAQVAAGQPFRAGVLLHMQPEWHTYWRNSGDAGLPTQVDWQLPAATRVSNLHWPLPAKYIEAGGLTAFGYEDEVLLFATITPPPILDDGAPLVLRARVSWLACRNVCVPGDTLLRLSLPVTSGSAAPAHTALFARYAARVPGVLPDDLGLRIGRTATSRGLRVLLTLTGAAPAEPGVPDFFPRDASVPLHVLLAAQAPPILELTVGSSTAPPPDSLRGVLVYRMPDRDNPRAGSLVVDLTQRAQRTAAEPGLLGLKSGTEAGAAQPGLLERDFSQVGRHERSLWIYLLLALGGGLLLNLMPCVLPVISLKVLGFVSQAGESRSRARQLGVAFAAGIVSSFVALAVIVQGLKVAGEQVGWGFQFQHPGFVVGMAVLIFALALSLFDVFTIDLTVGGIGKASTREGLLASFMNGVLATILATPCTAPLLGTALGFAFTQSAPVVLGVFVASGVGMAAPYVVLAVRPGWMRLLPRPGAWMGRFKQAMGFLLMGTVLWLLQVLSRQVGADGVVRTGALLLLAAVALWIAGQWGGPTRARWRRVALSTVAGLIIAAGYALLVRPVLGDRPMLHKAQPSSTDDLRWEPFTTARVDQLLRQGTRPVFLDFTAEWCWTCKVNERTALASDAVRSRFREMNVALVRADWTRRSAEITAVIRAFGRSGVPLYVLFPAGAADQPLILPELLTAGTVLEYLDRARAISAAREESR